MLMFTLDIYCLTTSNLPWFMDLTFRVPMLYCSLQHWTLLLSPVPSTTGFSFCFGSIPSFFLELFLHWSPIAYWAPIDLGSSFFSVLSFCLFILLMGFSRQENWSVLPFTSTSGTHSVRLVHHDLSIFGWPHTAWLSLTELDKTVVLGSDWLVPVIMVSVYLPSDALLQHLPSYGGLSYLGCGVSLHGCSSKVQRTTWHSSSWLRLCAVTAAEL